MSKETLFTDRHPEDGQRVSIMRARNNFFIGPYQYDKAAGLFYCVESEEARTTVRPEPIGELLAWVSLS